MLVRFIKQIKVEDFARITTALSKMEEISSVLNQDFLASALSLGTPSIKNKAEGMVFNKRGIGPFVNTKYALTQVAAGVACNREYPDDTDRPRKFAAFVELQWAKDHLDASEEFNDLYLIVAGDQEMTEVFTMGDFVRRSSGDNQIFSLASFFYRRRALYEKVYKVLVANKNRLEKFTNSVFADAFITLFSVKAKLEKVENFAIPKTNFDVYVSPDSNNPYQELLSDKKNVSYYLHPDNLSIHNVKLTFEAPNFLTIEFTLSDYFRDEHLRAWTESNISTTIGQPIFEAFIAKHLNAWLKNLVLLSIFQTKIYQAVKTKLLITQI